MIDWNNDGKHDWQDDAFYCLLLNDEKEQNGDSSSDSSGDGSGVSFSVDSGMGWFVVVLIVYWLIKIFVCS